QRARGHMAAMLRTLIRFDKPRPAARAGALQAVYDAAATSWQDGITKLGFDRAYADLMQAVPHRQPPAARVLDVGTGTGAFARAWIDAQGRPDQLTLTDLSNPMLAAASRRLAPCRAVQAPIGADLSDLPAQDVLLCAHVIEHLDAPQAALSWLHDRLAPGGTLILALSKPH
ncbi:MAG: class I SAM-dependent methyltransferase, partial [Pseudomonadota bacterium]